nr:hypothetical protein [uncultured Flavobacterium sp.]
MRNIFLIVLFLIVFTSCKTGGYVAEKLNNTSFQSIQIDTLFQDKMSIRAILIDANKVWYAADESRFGFYDLEKDKKNENRIENDSLKFEFRSIAQTSSAVFILTVSNPALLYRISKDGSEIKLVYQENHEKVFYDSMQFWNDKEGIAIGDPISDCLSILITRDGGNSWKQLSADSSLFTIRFMDENTAIAAGKNKMIRLNFKK